jgi:FixJ family two-component response regulator
MRVEGIHAAAFASAEEYLDHAAPTAPCCLVLDMQLPGMSGYALAQLLDRERPPLPPTIFISAHDNLLASLKNDRLAYASLRKPFEIDHLLALVKPLLRTALLYPSVPRGSRSISGGASSLANVRATRAL